MNIVKSAVVGSSIFEVKAINLLNMMFTLFFTSGNLIAGFSCVDPFLLLPLLDPRP